MGNLMDCKELIKNINNDNTIIIDCRFDLSDKAYGKRSYDQGHIKGSFRFDMEEDLASKVKEHGGRHPFPDLKEFKNKLENIGINNNANIIVYDDGEIAGAARAWSILKYIGHEKVYVLNGGITEYKRLNGPLDTLTSESNKSSSYDIKLNKDMICSMEYVKQNISNKSSLIIDSREFKRYKGEFEPIDIKAGHIPSAKNYFWMEILKVNEYGNKVIKDKKDLQMHFKELAGFSEIIVYCGSGITATPNALALSILNIKYKIYAGSFSDWISYDENEVETF